MNFVKTWLEKGNAENEDSIFRFFCYFIAFNYIYKEYKNNSDNDKMFEKLHLSGEKQQICLLLKDFNSTITPYDFTVLLNDNSLLRTTKIINMKSGDPYVCPIKDSNMELFLNIYQIRCNLFHGSKNMVSSRDHQLIIESNIVLKAFLEKELQRKCYDEPDYIVS